MSQPLQRLPAQCHQHSSGRENRPENSAIIKPSYPPCWNAATMRLCAKKDISLAGFFHVHLTNTFCATCTVCCPEVNQEKKGGQMETQLPGYHMEESLGPVAKGHETKITVARRLLKSWGSRHRPCCQHHFITFPCLPSTCISLGLFSLFLFSSQLKVDS